MTGWNCDLCASADILETNQAHDGIREFDENGMQNADIPINPYHVLQVRIDATPAEIRQSYKRLALWHHPGRTHESLEERQRRLQVFEVLAASYETLIDVKSRERFDAFVREIEATKLTKGLPAGAMFVGGKRLVGNESPARSLLSSFDVDDDRIPPLSRSSTGSSSSSVDEEDHRQLTICSANSSNSSEFIHPASLVDVSTSGSNSEEEAEAHYTEDETNRLFGGPLAQLYKVRNFEPFADPFDVFERVFGSQPFKVDREELGRLKSFVPLKSTRVAGWRGSSARSPDGKTTIFTTSRVLHDRRLTRTEKLTVDPATGAAQSFVTVTSNDLDEEFSQTEEESNGSWLTCYQGIGFAGSDSIFGGETLCVDFSDMYDNFVEEIDIYQNSISSVFNGNSALFPVWN